MVSRAHEAQLQRLDSSCYGFAKHFEFGSTTKSRTFLSSLYHQTIARPFGGLPRFRIDDIVDLAQDRLSEAQDDLWLLKTDPAFFDAVRYN